MLNLKTLVQKNQKICIILLKKFSWRESVKVLAKLHKVDFRKVGLNNFGYHSNYYNRQIETLLKISKFNNKKPLKDCSSKFELILEPKI